VDQAIGLPVGVLLGEVYQGHKADGGARLIGEDQCVAAWRAGVDKDDRATPGLARELADARRLKELLETIDGPDTCDELIPGCVGVLACPGKVRVAARGKCPLGNRNVRMVKGVDAGAEFVKLID
jgi:hypothetical protein